MAPNVKINFCQADFFYDVKWGREIDNAFIDFLSFEARLGNFVWPDKTVHSMLDAKDKICNQFNESFSFLYFMTRLDVLEQRFSTFKWMLSVEGVIYDREVNVVGAPDHVWNSMLEQNTFAHAYLVIGDANYEDLCVIFAPGPIEVINLSSDEDTPAQHEKGKLYPNVGPSNHSPLAGVDNHSTNRGKGKLFPHTRVSRGCETSARPPRPLQFPAHFSGPVINGPTGFVPPYTPLDLVHVSNNSVQTPPFNIFDFMEYFSDSESGGTDISSANSYNYGALGQHSELDRKKKYSGRPRKCRVSATDSCSPFPKEKH